jgi:hypothetical protein
MPVAERTIKVLFAKSQNKCANPDCNAALVVEETVLGEICHIRARRKGGARYDPSLTAEERDSTANLILLCPTCHSLVDKDKSGAFSVEWLTEIKADHERNGGVELSAQDVRRALALLEKHNARGKRAIKQSNVVGTATAKANNSGVAVSIAGNNQGDIHIKTSSGNGFRGYAKNSIGADANLSGYIEYLCDLYVKYMSLIEDSTTAWKRIGKNIKDKFRLRKRARNDMPAERFSELVAFMVAKLAATPVGQKHRREGTRLCSSFEEWRTTTK